MEEGSVWQPTASPSALAARARIYQQIRKFFAAREVMEVEVPLMAATSSSDPAIDSFAVICAEDKLVEPEKYLQTSPESAMKRLLAAGFGAIYYLGKAFRKGESGPRHNPEFTLLEWYRPGFDDHQLITEVAELVQCALPATVLSAQGAPEPTVNKFTYRSVFEHHLGVDPHTTSAVTLRQLAQNRMDIKWDEDDKDVWLDLLFTHVIEPSLPPGLTFVYDYPASQAALAKIAPDASGQPVARRFEAFINGMELANGYWELTDPGEQQRRIVADLDKRQARGQPAYPPDRHLVAALEAGMPESAGVALGIDRLIMLAVGASAIDQVIAFPVNRV